MRTFIASLVVLTMLMVSIGVYSKYLDRTMNNIEKCMGDVSDCVYKQKWSEGKSEIQRLSDIWKENEPILAMFNDHEDVDKIKLAIGELKENVLQEDYEHTIKSLKETAILLERIKKNETLSLENILKVSHFNANSHIVL